MTVERPMMLYMLFSTAMPYTINVRRQNILKLRETMPNSMFTCYDVMGREEKLLFLLSPLNCKYIPEWQKIYVEISSMVYTLYATRAKLYDALTASDMSTGVLLQI